MDIISTETGNRPQKRVRWPGVEGEKSPPELRGRRKQNFLQRSKTQEKNQGTGLSQKPRKEYPHGRWEWPTLPIPAKMAHKMNTKKCPLSQVSHCQRKKLTKKTRGEGENESSGAGLVRDSSMD